MSFVRNLATRRFEPFFAHNLCFCHASVHVIAAPLLGDPKVMRGGSKYE